MRPAILAMPGNAEPAATLAALIGGDAVAATVRRFPDAESYVRVEEVLAGRPTFIVCTLDRPDDKLVPLMLLAAAARDAGATKVVLVAPYLPYMRQDRRFRPGETESARLVARWLSMQFDALVTVDPHLHRIATLSEIYSIPSRVVHAAPDVAQWIRDHVPSPLLIGPDEESAQWVQDVARRADAPFIVLSKARRGDHDVEVSVPQLERWRSSTPVLVDDIVSTARTMAETAGHLRRAGMPAPVCIAVHAIFAAGAEEALRTAGAGDVVSCDTVPHPSNRIRLAPAIADAMRRLPDR